MKVLAICMYNKNVKLNIYFVVHSSDLYDYYGSTTGDEQIIQGTVTPLISEGHPSSRGSGELHYHSASGEEPQRKKVCNSFSATSACIFGKLLF